VVLNLFFHLVSQFHFLIPSKLPGALAKNEGEDSIPPLNTNYSSFLLYHIKTFTSFSDLHPISIPFIQGHSHVPFLSGRILSKLEETRTITLVPPRSPHDDDIFPRTKKNFLIISDHHHHWNACWTPIETFGSKLRRWHKSFLSLVVEES